jgi:hypothetical protein
VSYLIVFFIAAVVGAAVYFLSIREDETRDDDAGISDDVVPQSSGSHAYLPLSASHQDWATRLTGMLGLLITVVVGAIALAVSVYLSVGWLAHKIGDAATNGGVPQHGA